MSLEKIYKRVPSILSRLPFFQPVRHLLKQENENKTYENQWGKLVVKNGFFTQHHRDILEAILLTSKYKFIENSIRSNIHGLVVDPYRVSRQLSISGNSTNNSFVAKKIEEMFEYDFDLYIHTKNNQYSSFEGLKIFQGNLRKEPLLNVNSRSGHGFSDLDTRDLYKISFSDHWVELLYFASSSIDKNFLNIRAMKHSISKYVVRFMDSHSTNNNSLSYNFDTIFNSLLTNQLQSTVYKYRQQIIEDLELISDCGYVIDRSITIISRK